MRKTSIALSIVSVLLLAVSCKSIPRAELIPMDMGVTTIVNGDGIDWQAASNEEVDVVIQSGFSPDNTQGIMAAGITNKTEDELVFDEADITFYGRKKSGDGEWKEMGQWKKSRQVTRAVFWKIYDVFRCLYSGDPMGIFGTEELLMADYGTRLDIDALGRPYSDSSVTRMNEIKRYSMGWLDENALLSGDTAAPGDELVGAFFLTPKKRYTEFKVEYTPSGSTDPVDFYYERSDAEYIENPWLDSPYKEHINIFNIGYSPLDNGLGISFSVLHPTVGGVGARVALNSRNLFATIDNLTGYQGNSLHDRYPYLSQWGPDASFNDAKITDARLYPSGLDIFLGVTVKAAPYLWVIAGGDFFLGPMVGHGTVTFRPNPGDDFVEYPEKIYYTVDDEFPMSGGVTLGLDCAVYFLNFFVTGTYDFLRNSWMMDVGAGVNL